MGGGRVGTSSARRAEPGTRTAPAPRAAKGGGGAGGAEGSAPPREGAAGAALRCAPAGRRAGRARRRKRRRRRWPEARSQPAAAQPAPGLASRRGPEEMEQEKYLPELMAEKDSLDPSFVHAMRLLADGKAPLPPDAAQRPLSHPIPSQSHPIPGGFPRSLPAGSSDLRFPWWGWAGRAWGAPVAFWGPSFSESSSRLVPRAQGTRLWCCWRY